MSESPEVETIKVAYMFTGQGSQEAGMWQYLEGSPAARRIFQMAEDITGYSLYDGGLSETSKAQPAIVAYSLAALAVAKEIRPEIFEIPPLFCLGHSVGEYSALAVAGAIKIEDVIGLVWQRGLFMEEAGRINPGSMVAILKFEDQDQVKLICQETGVEVANYNCPGQIVISGRVGNIGDAVRLAKERKMKAIPLNVSIASHSSLMKPAQDKLAKVLAEVECRDPQTPTISNVTARPYESVDQIRELLAKQLTSSVRWEESVRYALENGANTFFEFGPKPGKQPVLVGLLERINPGIKGIFVVDRILKDSLD